MGEVAAAECSLFNQDFPSVRELRKGLIRRRPVYVSLDTTFDVVNGIHLTATCTNPEHIDHARRAFELYVSNNEFVFVQAWQFKQWTKIHPEAARLVKRIGVNAPNDGNMSDLASGLKRCINLEQVSIGVDEAGMVHRYSSAHRQEQGFLGHHYTILMDPTAIDRQLNLLVLRPAGVDKLRALRIPLVSFTEIWRGRHPPVQPTPSGPIPEGILETVVAKEMMIQPSKPVQQPSESAQRKRKRRLGPGPDVRAANKVSKTVLGTRRSGRTTRISYPVESEDEAEEKVAAILPEFDFPTHVSSHDQPFRFLDLPAEVRNMVYHHVLRVDGKINPSKHAPTSSYRNGRKDQSAYPHSVLSLLQTNKQVVKEAVGIYYAQNEFVFYHPNQLTMFLMSISDSRKAFVNKVSLWCEREAGNTVYSMEIALQSLWALPNLRSLELVIDRLLDWSFTWSRVKGQTMIQDLAKSKAIDVHIKSFGLERYTCTGAPRIFHVPDKRMDEWKAELITFEKRMRGEFAGSE